LAMGLQVALARVGTAFALAFSVPIAKITGVANVSRSTFAKYFVYQSGESAQCCRCLLAWR
jgi:hypothetical protein